MQLTARHLVSLLIVCASLLLAVFLAKDSGAYAGIVGVVGGNRGRPLRGERRRARDLPSTPSPTPLRRAARGERCRHPAGALAATTRRMHEELNPLRRSVAPRRETEKRAAAEIGEAVQMLDDLLKRLGDGVGTQLSASEETARSIKDMTAALRDIAQHVETLASSAEESSSSILEMTATNDEVAENIGELAAQRARDGLARSRRWPTRSRRSPRTSTRSRSPPRRPARR